MPVMHSLSKLLLKYAQQMEDQHAPQDMTIALREAAAEIERLRAGGCARDQGLTQYCAEAAAKDADIARLAAEVEQLLRESVEDEALIKRLGDQNDVLHSEVERLRAVLERIEAND